MVVIVAAMGFLGLAFSFGVALRTGDWEGFLLNLGTELVGAVAIYIVLNLVMNQEKRKKQRRLDCQTAASGHLTLI